MNNKITVNTSWISDLSINSKEHERAASHKGTACSCSYVESQSGAYTCMCIYIARLPKEYIIWDYIIKLDKSYQKRNIYALSKLFAKFNV